MQSTALRALSRSAGRAARSAHLSSTALLPSYTPAAAALRRHALQPSRRTLATSTDRTDASLEPTDLDRVTRLGNGVRVATEALPGPFAAVGVYVDAGSRYESAELRGVSHIVDRLAFKSTRSRTADQMLEALESLGGNMHCASSRETLMYQAATFNAAVPDTLALLADTIRDPNVTEHEVQQQLETAEYEIGEIWSKPELILPELVHMAAYKDNTLGNPLLCPQERLPFINKQTVDKYRETFYKPERLVVAFAGVEHEEALRLTEKWFADMKSTDGPVLSQVGAEASINQKASAAAEQVQHSAPSGTGSKLLDKIPLFKNMSTSATSKAQHASNISTDPTEINLYAPSHYTGGFLALPNIPPPANPALPRLSHIHVAFEALPISSSDIYALAVLQTLLGGGGSFSAGGPGKGMYSRLYRNVLNQYGWVENCVSFNHSYTDSGLFGISGACQPRYISQMLEVICRELHNLTVSSGYSGLKHGEVQRAKNQLKSSLLMNLESRMVELEDLGRQIQVHGRKVGVKEMCAAIDALTIDDLRRVANQVFTGHIENPGKGTGAPTVVVQEGDEENVTQAPFAWEAAQERIAQWKLGRR